MGGNGLFAVVVCGSVVPGRILVLQLNLAENRPFGQDGIPAESLATVDFSYGSNDEKIAFFLNIYNAMLIDAHLIVPFGSSVFSRSSLFSKVWRQLSPTI